MSLSAIKASRIVTPFVTVACASYVLSVVTPRRYHHTTRPPAIWYADATSASEPVILIVALPRQGEMFSRRRGGAAEVHGSASFIWCRGTPRGAAEGAVACAYAVREVVMRA